MVGCQIFVRHVRSLNAVQEASRAEACFVCANPFACQESKTSVPKVRATQMPQD